jgi:D-glycero-D-manno-heptose 1,7-bisphosphate phosphatase
MKRALFLDRDGIFNEIVMRNGRLSCPRNWSEVRHYNGLEDLKRIKKAGFLLIMVTNQPDIERGFITLEFTNELHRLYQTKYDLDAVYVCPFSSNSHPMKKPNPGMLLQASEEHHISLPDSFFLGDSSRDMETAKRAGCKGILWSRAYNEDVEADFVIQSLEEVFHYVAL